MDGAREWAGLTLFSASDGSVWRSGHYGYVCSPGKAGDASLAALAERSRVVGGRLGDPYYDVERLEPIPM